MRVVSCKKRPRALNMGSRSFAVRQIKGILHDSIFWISFQYYAILDINTDNILYWSDFDEKNRKKTIFKFFAAASG